MTCSAANASGPASGESINASKSAVAILLVT
jgi:hypothetical protein